MTISLTEKKKVLEYLKGGEEVATAAGYVMDHKKNEYTKIPLVLLSNNVFEWTSEDIYNFDLYDEIFNNKLIKFILNI